MIGVYRKLRADDRGAAVIEMALVAPVLAAIVVGMIDLSNGYSVKLKLEQAAQRTIEKAQQTVVTTTMLDTLQAEGTAAATEAGVTADSVTVDFWLECNGSRQSDYNSDCPGGQTYARYLTVAIQGTYTPTFATRFAGANADGTYTIVGRAGIRTQ